MVITETSELDCMIVVLTIPKEMAFQSLVGGRFQNFLEQPAGEGLEAILEEQHAEQKIETPAAISLKSGADSKIHKPELPRMTGRMMRRIMNGALLLFMHFKSRQGDEDSHPITHWIDEPSSSMGSPIQRVKIALIG